MNSPYFDAALIQADGLVFRIDGGPPATYCPDIVSQISQCPPGTETDFSCQDGFCGLVRFPLFSLPFSQSGHLSVAGRSSLTTFSVSPQNVEVPGGQQIYVTPNGAVSFTQAHTNLAPPGSYFSGFSLKGEVLKFGDEDFYACPPADNSPTSQLYVGFPEVEENPECYKIELITAPGNDTGFAAWQYT